MQISAFENGKRILGILGQQDELTTVPGETGVFEAGIVIGRGQPQFLGGQEPDEEQEYRKEPHRDVRA